MREGKNTEAKRYGCGGCKDQNKKRIYQALIRICFQGGSYKNKKDIYTIDNGFIEAVAYSSSQDMGKFSENKDFKWQKLKSILF